ncbi:MAG TPA: thiol-disulfide oxidoreductase DCC family protein [Phaeodactylibacter sp.]|nr:thiol-disulfide oxidoreductase DCC family protein [Phaeodactylibacter sp.]
MKKNTRPILLFDGICKLCNASVQFIIKKDKDALFRFASLQSEVGQSLLQNHQLSTKELESAVLLVEDKVYTRSSAALQVLRRLGLPWSLMAVFLLLPKGIRDIAYNIIAKNRYRWFGKKDSCMMPTEDIKSRFLS